MKRKKHRINLLQVALLAICLFCFGALCYEMVWMPYANQSQTEDLKARFPEKNGDPAPEGESAGKETGVQAVDLSALQAQYPAVRGWLAIPGTPIDYPVMQSGEENPEYYLGRNYQGEYDINGSLFLQWDCSIEAEENLIIYGHNMNNGAMFGSLDRYRDPAYWGSHRKVFFQSKNGMEEYVELAKSQELFETGENAADCHTVLTLVTCAYEWDGARTVVIAVR